MGEKSNSCKYFFRKLEGNRLLRRTRRKRNLLKCTKRGKEVLDWFNLARDRNKCWTVVRDLCTAWATIRFSGRNLVSRVSSARRTHINGAVSPGKCVCVSEWCTRKMTRECQMSQFEQILPFVLVPRTPLGGPPTLLYNGHFGGSGKAARTWS